MSAAEERHIENWVIFEGERGGHDESNSVEADRIPNYIMEFQIRGTTQLKTYFEL